MIETLKDIVIASGLTTILFFILGVLFLGWKAFSDELKKGDNEDEN